MTSVQASAFLQRPSGIAGIQRPSGIAGIQRPSGIAGTSRHSTSTAEERTVYLTKLAFHSPLTNPKIPSLLAKGIFCETFLVNPTSSTTQEPFGIFPVSLQGSFWRRTTCWGHPRSARTARVAIKSSSGNSPKVLSWRCRSRRDDCRLIWQGFPTNCIALAIRAGTSKDATGGGVPDVTRIEGYSSEIGLGFCKQAAKGKRGFRRAPASIPSKTGDLSLGLTLVREIGSGMWEGGRMSLLSLVRPECGVKVRVKVTAVAKELAHNTPLAARIPWPTGFRDAPGRSLGFGACVGSDTLNTHQLFRFRAQEGEESSADFKATSAGAAGTFEGAFPEHSGKDGNQNPSRALNMSPGRKGAPNPDNKASISIRRSSKPRPARQAGSLYEELARYGLDGMEYMSCGGRSSIARDGAHAQETSTTFPASDSGTGRRVPWGGGGRGRGGRAVAGVESHTADGSSLTQSSGGPAGLESQKEDEYEEEWGKTTGNDEVAGEDWWVYCLVSADQKKTYVGVSTDVERRVRQHNGEIAGGAKSTRAGRPWDLLCKVSGFKGRSAAFQFEWRWKNPRNIKGDGSLTRDNLENVPGESAVVARRKAALKEVQRSFEGWDKLTIHWGPGYDYYL